MCVLASLAFRHSSQWMLTTVNPSPSNNLRLNFVRPFSTSIPSHCKKQLRERTRICRPLDKILCHQLSKRFRLTTLVLWTPHSTILTVRIFRLFLIIILIHAITPSLVHAFTSPASPRLPCFFPSTRLLSGTVVYGSATSTSPNPFRTCRAPILRFLSFPARPRSSSVC